jgi:hypothetical protein
MSVLRFEITAVERADADSPAVRFRLVNTGPEAVLVNGRLAVTQAGGAGDVQLSAVSDAGDVPFVADVNVGRPKAADFRELAPGDSVARDVDLRRYLLLRAPGSYTVTAAYRNKVAGVDGMADVAWTGELAAEPLTVTV